MKVESVREIDVDDLIVALDAKIANEDKDARIKKYEAKVNKALLKDIVDVLRHYRKQELANGTGE